MIIRFENLDNPSYSAQFSFDNNGFKCAEYDYSGFFDVVDPDLSSENSFTDFLNKGNFNLFTDDFVDSYLHPHWEQIWHSYKVSFSNGSYQYVEGFNKWIQNNFDEDNNCSCRASYNGVDENDCPNNVYEDFIEDSWTSSFCLKITSNNAVNHYFNITWRNYLAFSNIDKTNVSCSNIGKLPTISFVEPDLNYPVFKIFAYDFDNFSNEDCKYSLFLHIIGFNSDNEKDIKTLKVGSFGVYRGDFYFENFYGNKVSPLIFPLRYFDFYTFFSTNTDNNVTDFMANNYNDLSDVNINSFGRTFVFELKKEDYSGVYMSALDCECLTNAINSLNSHIDNFTKSFSEAFNKVPVSGQLVSGSGSVFKSNDGDDYDYYHLIDNKGKSCDSPLNVNLCPFTFSEVPVKINSIPALDVDIDTMPTSRLVTHVNSAVDISCVCNELDDIDKGLVAEFASMDLSLTAIKTAVDGVAAKFVTGCDTSIASAFSEAFNLTNCHGSVFKANDDNWNGEDTISGIWYKQLDFGYINSHFVDSDLSTKFKAFYSYYGGYWDSLSKTLRCCLFDNDRPLPEYSVFKVHNTNYSLSTLLRDIFMVSASQNFRSSHFYNDGNVLKLLFHGCSGNPNSVKFCDNSLPVDIVNSSDSPVKVEMEPSSSINVNVESAPSDPANIYINADGKTFLNNNNFR